MFNKIILSPESSYYWVNRWLPWALGVGFASLAVGLYWGLYAAPPDYQQGEAYRIIYMHVPAAWMSLFIYVVMAAAGITALVWRVKFAEIVCVESAPIGASFTALALITGMLWGKPMWGAYWVWDARLTSELILLFLYFGVIALHSAIADPRKAARAAGLLAVIGSVNIPIIHYSVVWWSTLHQGPTVTRFDTPAAHSSILLPLLFMAIVFMLLYSGMLLARVRNALITRNRDSRWVANVRSIR